MEDHECTYSQYKSPDNYILYVVDTSTCRVSQVDSQKVTI